MMCHPTKDRPLSVAEYARIQQFPDSWIITGTVQEKYRQIGNAVPVGLAKAIGEAIVSAAMGKATVEARRTRGTGVHSRIQAAVTLGEAVFPAQSVREVALNSLTGNGYPKRYGR